MPQNRKFSSKQAGFTLIEVLLASVITIIGLLGIGTALYHLQKTHQRNELIQNAIILENDIQSAILDRATYDNNDALRQALNDPDITSLPDSVQFRLPLRITFKTDAGVQQLAIKPEKLNSAGNGYYQIPLVANGCDEQGAYGSHGCPYAIRVGLAKFGKQWRFAKRVIVSDDQNEILMKNSALSSQQKFVDPLPVAEYTTAIPDEYYSNTFKSTCDPDPATGQRFYGVRGVADSSVTCIPWPDQSATCGVGQLALGVTFDGTSLRPDCSTTPTVTCPTGYRLQNLPPLNLIPGRASRTANASCVLAAAKTKDISLTGVEKVEGIVCPMNYVLDPTTVSCSLTPGTENLVPGTCQKSTFTWTQVVDGAGRHQWKTVPGPSEPYSVPAVAGFASQFYDADTATVVCKAIIPPQACGAKWTSLVSFTGGCISTLPETVSARTQ